MTKEDRKLMGGALKKVLKGISIIGRSLFKTINELIWFGAGLWLLNHYYPGDPIVVPTGFVYLSLLALLIYYFLKTRKELRYC